MTQKQIKLAARLVAVYILDKASDEERSVLDFEQVEGRLDAEEADQIYSEVNDLANRLLKTDVHFNTLQEIIYYCKTP